MTRLRELIYFIRLGRPLFLAGGFVFNGLGIAIALYQGFPFSWAAAIVGQIAITSIQLMTHYSNDYFDLPADRANQTATRWSGGSRILAEGLMPAQVGLYAAMFFGAVALFTSVVLTGFVQPAALTFPLLLLSILLAWEYSAPPLRLHSRGLGEVTVALLVPVLTPLVGYYLQSGVLTWLPLLASWPLACLQAGMILVINFPDAAGDRQESKRTLVIRLGATGAVRLYLALISVAYLSLPLLVWAGLPPTAALALTIPLPLAVWQCLRMWRGDWQKPAAWNSLGFWSIGLLMGSAMLETLAFFWLAFR
jgi:1,4-dihydroxy-2-naphthoate octaprenyltransferase